MNTMQHLKYGYTILKLHNRNEPIDIFDYLNYIPDGKKYIISVIQVLLLSVIKALIQGQSIGRASLSIIMRSENLQHTQTEEV